MRLRRSYRHEPHWSKERWRDGSRHFLHRTELHLRRSLPGLMAAGSSQREAVVVMSQPKNRSTAGSAASHRRDQWKANLKAMVRAKLPYDHPLRYRVSGPALREILDQGMKARRWLEKYDLLETVTKEISDEIVTDARTHYAAEVASAEADLVRLRRHLEQGELRLTNAREEERAYMIASGSPKPEAS